MLLKIDKASKTIKKKKVLDDVSAEFKSGLIYAVVGRNGSGKTMLFRALSGLMKVDSGAVTLDGRRLHKDFEMLPGLGIMLENAGLYPDLSAVDNLSFLMGINKKPDIRIIKEYISRVGLDPEDKRPFRKYSLGMKHRLVFAQAIMDNPSILLLDEPTNSLDEGGVSLIRELVLNMKDENRIIIITSHNREDIDMLADVVYSMSDGRLTKVWLDFRILLLLRQYCSCFAWAMDCGVQVILKISVRKSLKSIVSEFCLTNF